MKSLIKSTIAITFLMLFVVTTGVGQEKDTVKVKNIYKLGISKLLVKQFFLGYEGIVSNHFSINTQLGFVSKAFYLESLSDMSLSTSTSNVIRTENTRPSQFFPRRTPTKFGGQVNLDFRYYPYGFERTFFIGARGGYRYVNFGDDLEIIYYRDVFGGRLNSKILDAKQNVIYYGVTIGSNVILGEKVALEFYVLIGRQYIELINPESIEVIQNPNDPSFEEFQNNHLNPVNKLHLEFGIYLGVGR